MKYKKIMKTILLILFISAVLLFLIRLFSEKQLDDVSPEISCDKEILEKAEVLFVIPKFNNESISENKIWCEYISSLNKEIALHGVYHIYHEFNQDRKEDYLQNGIDIFEECFNITPKKFKPPQLKISENNKKLINKKMEIDLRINQIFHKVYHCDNTGIFSNEIIDIF